MHPKLTKTDLRRLGSRPSQDDDKQRNAETTNSIATEIIDGYERVCLRLHWQIITTIFLYIWRFLVQPNLIATALDWFEACDVHSSLHDTRNNVREHYKLGWCPFQRSEIAFLNEPQTYGASRREPRAPWLLSGAQFAREVPPSRLFWRLLLRVPRHSFRVLSQ